MTYHERGNFCRGLVNCIGDIWPATIFKWISESDAGV